MQTNEYLFPQRCTRRDFLSLAGTATAAFATSLSFTGCALKPPAKPAVRIGSGYHTYEVIDGWGELPDGMKYGLGCGVVVDGQDRVYVTSRSNNPCVAVFDRRGRLLETWSHDFGGKVGLNTEQVKDTAHCLYWSKERDGEFFYWTENRATTKEQTPGVGRRVYKTDLRGKILYEIGNVAREGSTAQKFDWTNPTDVAVAPNGDIYIVDGYGSQRVSRFDKNFKHLRTIGQRTASNTRGPDAPPATFNTCHGVWINTLRGKKIEPEVYIADRHNDRLQVFDLELNFKRVIKGSVRNPCCFYQHGKWLYIPDLASRVTILDANDQVVAQLGDGKGAADNKTNPALFATPHALCVDSRGDFYTVEWVESGRPRKFKHTPDKV